VYLFARAWARNTVLSMLVHLHWYVLRVGLLSMLGIRSKIRKSIRNGFCSLKCSNCGAVWIAKGRNVFWRYLDPISCTSKKNLVFIHSFVVMPIFPLGRFVGVVALKTRNTSRFSEISESSVGSTPRREPSKVGM